MQDGYITAELLVDAVEIESLLIESRTPLSRSLVQALFTLRHAHNLDTQLTHSLESLVHEYHSVDHPAGTSRENGINSQIPSFPRNAKRRLSRTGSAGGRAKLELLFLGRSLQMLFTESLLSATNRKY